VLGAEDTLAIIKEISVATASKIVLMVVDGLGGLPQPKTGKTELETARTPNLDRLAEQGICGLTDPVAPGITPGSAPGHLALFGYDPVRCIIGRGVLEAVGIDFDLQAGDIAARGNFCTIDENGLVTDRRAGRVSTEECARLCRLLDEHSVAGVKVLVTPVREHRFVAVFRGDGLALETSDSDPLRTGVPPKPVAALNPEADRLASAANSFADYARTVLAPHHPANMALLRGFSRTPHLPGMTEIYRLTPAAIASYPMYRGLAKLVGMDVLSTGPEMEDEFRTLEENYDRYDFFFLHIKPADNAGEDGDFERRVAILERLDRNLSRLIELEPDVVVVAGDHSTPAMLKGHSWHPVPVLLSARWCRPDQVTGFAEPACASGGLGRLPATQIMPLAMANALKLNKFGA
jgi:2,3-bisphosphoglycerate-independent phosphoglycerate mutase